MMAALAGGGFAGAAPTDAFNSFPQAPNPGFAQANQGFNTNSFPQQPQSNAPFGGGGGGALANNNGIASFNSNQGGVSAGNLYGAGQALVQHTGTRATAGNGAGAQGVVTSAVDADDPNDVKLWADATKREYQECGKVPAQLPYYERQQGIFW